MGVGDVETEGGVGGLLIEIFGAAFYHLLFNNVSFLSSE